MQSQQYWIGIDLHTHVMQACVLDEAGERCLEKRYRGSSLEEGRDVVRDLAEQFPGAHIAVEAVGTNRWFVRACRECGLQVTVVHAGHLGLKQSGRKTDRRDAYELARRHRLGDIERNARSYHPTELEYGWRQLLRQRHNLVQERTSLITRVRAMLRAHRTDQPKGDIYGPRNLKKVKAIRLENTDEQVVFEVLLSALEMIHGSIVALDHRIAEFVHKHPRVAPLLAIPYVGPITAGTLVSELGDVHRFRNAKAVASYAGLVPRVQQSADQAHNGRLVRHGNRELRYVLGEWAVQLLSRHPIAKAWAAPRLSRMPKNKVRVALARKLLVGVWHTLRTGEVFSLERCLATA